MTHRPASLTIVVMALLCSGCDDECAPTDYGGGQECGDEQGLSESCSYVDCRHGVFCVSRWVIQETYCPAYMPHCEQLAPGEVGCAGERLGPCSAQGFVRCEGPLVQVTCLEEASGNLELHRGACAAGSRCYELGEEAEQPGCQPSY